MAICQPLLQVVTDWPHIVQLWHVSQGKTNVTNAQRPRKIDNWGGAHIHIFVFTDCKNNRFQKKLMMHNTNI